MDFSCVGDATPTSAPMRRRSSKHHRHHHHRREGTPNEKTPSSPFPLHHHPDPESAEAKLLTKYVVSNEVIGRGGYGCVVRGFSRDIDPQTKRVKEVAIKRIFKEKVSQKGVSAALMEVETMRVLNHQAIVRVEDVCMDQDNLFIVMELVPGGELGRLAKKHGGWLPESTVQRLAYDLLHGLEHIHSNGIVHRDLKLANCLVSAVNYRPPALNTFENFLDNVLRASPSLNAALQQCCDTSETTIPALLNDSIASSAGLSLEPCSPKTLEDGDFDCESTASPSTQGPSSPLSEHTTRNAYSIDKGSAEEPIIRAKISDFGLAAMAGTSECLTAFCGTTVYMAPEVLARGAVSYGQPVDMWSLGVLIYVLLCGEYPFRGKDEPELIDTIAHGRYGFTCKRWQTVTAGAKQFVASLLTVDPSRRATVSQALSDPWILKVNEYDREDDERALNIQLCMEELEDVLAEMGGNFDFTKPTGFPEVRKKSLCSTSPREGKSTPSIHLSLDGSASLALEEENYSSSLPVGEQLVKPPTALKIIPLSPLSSPGNTEYVHGVPKHLLNQLAKYSKRFKVSFRKRLGRLFKIAVIAVLASHRLMFRAACLRLRLIGANIAKLRSFSFLVGNVCEPRDLQLIATPKDFAGNFPALHQLTDMLQISKTVTVFDVSHNNIDSAELVHRIVNVTQSHPSLTSLNMAYNPLPSSTSRALLTLSRTANCLKILNVNCTPLGSEVAVKISQNLRELDGRRRRKEIAAAAAAGEEVAVAQLACQPSAAAARAQARSEHVSSPVAQRVPNPSRPLGNVHTPEPSFPAGPFRSPIQNRTVERRRQSVARNTESRNEDVAAGLSYNGSVRQGTTTGASQRVATQSVVLIGLGGGSSPPGPQRRRSLGPSSESALPPINRPSASTPMPRR